MPAGRTSRGATATADSSTQEPTAMRLSKHKHRTTAEMNMTPMIDIVFLLIIFFMTVSQVSEINRERLDLPKQPGAEDQKPAKLTINVDPAGQIIVSGNRVSLAQLLAIVSQELAAVGDNPDRVAVVLRSDQHARSQAVNEIVTALNRMQIKRVRIAVEVPQ
jgi:biopolymer transport protein ExbD